MQEREKFLNRQICFVKGFLIFLKQLPPSTVNTPLVNQAVRSSASIGANYTEALEAESRRDFIHKLSICKKETRETLYWIEILASQNKDKLDQLREYWREAHEFLLIYSKSLQTAKKKITK